MAAPLEETPKPKKSAATPVPSRGRPSIADAPPGGRRPARRRIRAGDLFFLVVLAGAIALFFLFTPRHVVEKMYSGTAAGIVAIMIAEYLLLKSTDRTRVYRLENQRLRERRRTDQAMLRRSRNLLDEQLQVDPAVGEEWRRRWSERAAELKVEIDETL